MNLQLNNFPNELNSGQAVVFLALATSDIDRNWENVLRENRRRQYRFTDTGQPIKKGNRHRLETLPFTKQGGKVTYKKVDLYTWIRRNTGALSSTPALQISTDKPITQSRPNGGILQTSQKEYKQQQTPLKKINTMTADELDKILKEIEAI